jgi:hypothetical protein
MNIREIQSNTDRLLERGHIAESNLVAAQRVEQYAEMYLEQAYAILRDAQRTDSEGNCLGDVAAARQQVSVAQSELYSAEAQLVGARSQLDGVNSDKRIETSKIERYNDAESRNLSIYNQLASLRFGSNIQKQIGDLMARMHSAEDAKAALMQSMGLHVTRRNFSAEIGAAADGSPSVSREDAQELMDNYMQSIGTYLSGDKQGMCMSGHMKYQGEQDFYASLVSQGEGNPYGILGYNDGKMSYVMAGRYEGETAIHEHIHMLSVNDIKDGDGNSILTKRGISISGSDVEVNEAMTEMFTRDVMGDKYPPNSVSAYNDNRERMELMREGFGDRLLKTAYFQNNPQLMQEHFNEVMGRRGAWDDFSQAFYNNVHASTAAEQQRAGFYANQMAAEFYVHSMNRQE